MKGTEKGKDVVMEVLQLQHLGWQTPLRIVKGVGAWVADALSWATTVGLSMWKSRWV